MILNGVPQAIADIKRGRMVIVVDDRRRENEGDLVMAASRITPEAVNFMATHGRGLICVPMTGDRLSALEIAPMVPDSAPPPDSHEAAFTVSVDARRGVTTGISAQDRAMTIHRLLNPRTKPGDLARPGHVFPLRYREGGVLVRAGHTEAAVDLCRLAGLPPAGVICEIMRKDGTMARLPELLRFARRFRLKIMSIADLIQHRRRTEKLIRRVVTTRLPTRWGEFALTVYEDTPTGEHHVALVRGEVAGQKDVLVRMHSSCFTGDVLHSDRCDCGQQLHASLVRIAQAGRGVLIYLHQEGRGIGLINKLKAYELQDKGLDTVQANRRLGFRADLREYGIGAQILEDLGLTTIHLLTNNPRKIVGIEGYHLKVTRRVPIEIAPTADSLAYLRAKKRKLGHIMRVV